VVLFSGLSFSTLVELLFLEIDENLWLFDLSALVVDGIELSALELVFDEEKRLIFSFKELEIFVPFVLFALFSELSSLLTLLLDLKLFIKLLFDVDVAVIGLDL
jgi:hypothetical protein